MFKLERVLDGMAKLPPEDVEWLKKTIYCMKCGFCRFVWGPNTPGAEYAYQLFYLKNAEKLIAFKIL